MKASLFQTLRLISVQIQQLGEHLSPFNAELGEDNTGHVRRTSASLLAALDELSARPGAPFEDREVRHDLRNQIAVVKGFAELMQLEVGMAHVVSPSLRQIVLLSDEFVAALNAVRSPAEGTSTLFA